MDLLAGRKVVVMCGNLSDGFTPVGPFDSWDEAAEWAEKYTRSMAWVMTMLGPDEALKDLEEV